MISIHALREEGDRCSPSTNRNAVISIHALREEGDPTTSYMFSCLQVISIHALREEGDLTVGDPSGPESVFLSTPSVRRATAKTEKNISAFVSL